MTESNKNSFGSLLNVSEVTKTFGGLVALKDVSMSIDKGKIYGLIGPNGSGKTTLVNIITGFARPTHGRIVFSNRDITGKSPHVIANLGVARTFQTPRSFPDLTVEENVNVGLGNQSREEANFRDVFNSTGLDSISNVKARDLSYGETKLMELARAALKGSSLIIMDEPISGIDLSNIRRFADFILYINQSLRRTVLIIEHNLEELIALANHIFVLHQGTKIFDGAPDKLHSAEEVVEAYFGTG